VGGLRSVRTAANARLPARSSPSTTGEARAQVGDSQAETLNAGQRAVLEHLAMGAPLDRLLDEIVRLIEAQAPGMLCSILTIDPVLACVRHVAAPNLPESYVRVLDGAPIGPEAGSCGAAASRGQRVIVEDISTHPFWTEYKQLALPHGLRACWSSPIFDTQGEVLGTFAMYYRETRGPSATEIGWVDVATHLAALAITRTRSEVELRASEARYRHLARLYAVSSAINETIARVREPDALYAAACRIAVEHGLAKLAWVGMLQGRPERLVPVARFGEDHGYVDRVIGALLETHATRGPAGRALETGRCSTSDDLATDDDFYFKADALERGLRSCAVFPLLDAGHVGGLLALYGDQPGMWGADELKVLSGLAENIAFAVRSSAAERDKLEAELALRDSEERLRAVIKHTPNVCIQWYDAGGRVLFANDATLRLFGWSQLDFVGKTLDQLNFSAEEAASFAQGIASVQATGSPVGPIDFTFRHPQGGEGTLLSTIFRIPYSKGESCFVCMDVDLTEYKRMQEAMHANEQLRAFIYDNVNDVIFCLAVEPGDQYRFLSVNPAFTRATGLPEQAVVGRRVDEIIPEPSLGLVRSKYRQAIATASPVSWQETSRYATGERHGEVSVTPVYDGAGRCVQLVGTVHDITDRKRVEEERRRIEEQLHHSQRFEALGTLAGGIAHDFNNVLSAVRCHTEFALMDSTPADEVKESLREIEKASRRAADMVRRILSFSRPPEAKRECVGLRDVVDEALGLLRAALRPSSSFNLQAAPDTPAVLADATQLHQVVMNLGANAAHAMSGNAGSIDITLSAFDLTAETCSLVPDLRDGRYARMRFSDHGTGMAPEIMARIFEPFFTTKPTSVGTGLGLSTVRGIIKSHGGAITVESQLGRGTTFELYLPAAHPELAAVAPEPAPRRSTGERVLYVDDDEALVFLVTRMLERLGYRPLGVVDPARALGLLADARCEIDAMIVDVNMPGLTGIDLARRARESRPNLRVLLVSGYPTQKDVDAAQALGNVSIVVKPQTIDEFARTLHALLPPGSE
jgi:PAS domain S-box-containing protein